MKQLTSTLPIALRSPQGIGRADAWRGIYVKLRAALFLLLIWMTCQGLQGNEKPSFLIGMSQAVTAECLDDCRLDGAINAPVNTSQAHSSHDSLSPCEADQNDSVMLTHATPELATSVDQYRTRSRMTLVDSQLRPLFKPPKSLI